MLLKLMSSMIAVLCLTGCYQLHSGDDLRTIPVTNNHHNLSETGRKAATPGVPGMPM